MLPTQGEHASSTSLPGGSDVAADSERADLERNLANAELRMASWEADQEARVADLERRERELLESQAKWREEAAVVGNIKHHEEQQEVPYWSWKSHRKGDTLDTKVLVRLSGTVLQWSMMRSEQWLSRWGCTSFARHRRKYFCLLPAPRRKAVLLATAMETTIPSRFLDNLQSTYNCNRLNWF